MKVEWKVSNEKDMKQYEVERSSNGLLFTKQATVAAMNTGSANYNWLDTYVLPGVYYYRIRCINVDGKIQYTGIVKVLIGDGKSLITIYPNPITDGMIHLQLTNAPEGKYKIKLINKLGQLIVQKQITHAGGSATELIKWDYNLAHGMYQLQVTKPDGTEKDLNVMY